jgi:dolichyl-phosphate-mannose--protein O-mannosyl transferase
VFDESHFGRFTNQYTARTYFFDIHPPLGKLMFWFVGYLVGYNHPPGQNPSQRPYLGLETDCKYEHISEAYHPACKFAWLRGVSAAHSSLTCLLMYLIGRRWSGTTWGGLMAAGLLVFDMLNHIEGRLVLMDVQLIFWCTASLYAAIRWWDRLNEHAAAEDAVAAGRPPPHRLLTLQDRLTWAVVVGLCCGNAFSVKMTGLATPALIGMESALGIWFLRRPARWLDLVTVLVTGFSIYLAYFALHFHLLTRHGDGDDEFMNLAFRKTILENKDYEPGAVWEGFWKTVIDLNIRMVVHNANILEPHPWQSKWWEWVFNLRGVSYYGQDKPHTYTDHMYLIGNHAIHWSVVVGLGGFLALTAFYFRYRTAPHFSTWLPSPALHPYFAQASFALAVYLLNMAPYVAVARSTFAYHYMPALVYGELIVARSIQVLAGPRYTPMAAKLYLGAVGLVWLHYTPWIYGMGLTNDGHQRRRWIERWN